MCRSNTALTAFSVPTNLLYSMHIDDDGSVVHILCYPDRYLQDARVDWCLDRAVDAIPAIDEGGTGVQTSGVLQMLLDLGCDRCSHGDYNWSLDRQTGMPWQCFCSTPYCPLHPLHPLHPDAVLSTGFN